MPDELTDAEKLAKLTEELEAKKAKAKLEAEEEDEDDDNDEDEDGKLSAKEQAAVDKQLAKMKSNMDKMSSKLATLAKEKSDAEQKAKEDKVEQLKSDGKLQEALELEIESLKAKLATQNETNTKLSRDVVLATALDGLTFRNARSKTMAQDDIKNQLVQGDDGTWSHKSGASIKDFVETYKADSENSFLFKAKPNKGGSTNPNDSDSAPDTSKKVDITKLTGAEMLARAAAGDLGSFSY